MFLSIVFFFFLLHLALLAVGQSFGRFFFSFSFFQNCRKDKREKGLRANTAKQWLTSAYKPNRKYCRHDVEIACVVRTHRTSYTETPPETYESEKKKEKKVKQFFPDGKFNLSASGPMKPIHTAHTQNGR